MPDLEITLPSARPDDYLRWMAFVREVEQRMGGSPGLEKLASDEGVPFLKGEIAAFLSSVVVGAIIAQAGEAQRRGDKEVAPTIAADRKLMKETIDVVSRRAQWLTDERLRAMGIKPLEDRLSELRAEALRAIEEQLKESP